MTDRKTVLVHIHVSQSDAATKAGAGSVKAVVASPAATHPHARAGSHAARSRSTSERSWAVAFHGQKYDVLDAGPKGITISRDGAVVWTGRRLPTGAYHTHTSTVPAPKLDGLLRLVAVGDERTPTVHVAEHHAAPATPRRARPRARTAAIVSKRPISEAQAEALARGREVRADQLASQRAGVAPTVSTKPKAKPGRRPTASAPPTAASGSKPTSKPRAKPTSKPASASAPAHPQGTPSAPAPPKRRPGRPRKQPATAPTPTSKKAERAPATRRSVRNPAVDDTAVLAEIKRKLKREDPKNASAHYNTLRRLWFAGGREATLAWMAANNIATLVEAFRDWVEKNPEAANALLEKAPQGGQSAAA